MAKSRLPKSAIRARMAATGESYQQAASALLRQVPDSWTQAPLDDVDCVGRCESVFLASDRAGRDAGSMTACAACPGAVCFECGRQPVKAPMERCDSCAGEVERAAVEATLVARCAGRTCVSRNHARTSDADSAMMTCEPCREPICLFCQRRPVSDWFQSCTECVIETGWSEDLAVLEVRRDLHYLAGLIVRRGGGSYRTVYARFGAWAGARLSEARLEQLDRCMWQAQNWAGSLAPDPRR
ncbi:hypothetical protein [Catellatospora methionotrophica]|uniref:hypothetical protein n=1 Tax=Catellatospora methionotrophica TaxID=121620 RepID=UPI0033E17422